MVQNYLYSNIISEIKKKIEENNFNIKLIYTNFSKNRINDRKTSALMASMDATYGYDSENKYHNRSSI